MVKGAAAGTAINEDGSITATISNATCDRDGEVLLPEGAQLGDFEKNGVVFYAHDYNTLPIARAYGTRLVSSQLISHATFADKPAGHPGEWLADTVKELVRQRILRGVSVGFIPLHWRMPTAEDLKTYGDKLRRVCTRWTLLEWSIVSLPCNPEALILADAKAIVDAVKRYRYVIETTPAPRRTVYYI
jgi:phage head maturation protease